MKYEYWFSGIRNIPDRTKIKLKEKAGTAEAIYYIEETALRKMQLLKEQEIWKLLEAKKKEELDRNYEAMRQKGISVIPWGEKEYPGRLKEIYDPPYALYVKGKLPIILRVRQPLWEREAVLPMEKNMRWNMEKNWRNVEFR